MSTVHEMAADIVEGYGEEPSECPCEQDLQVAALLIAKGWVKPRTITTVEELDELRFGMAVLSADGIVWVNDGDTLDQWASFAENHDGGPLWRGSADIALPATILFEGQA